MSSRSKNQIIAITAVTTIAFLAIWGLNYSIQPYPVIVSSKSSFASSKLFEYSVSVSAVIRNDGGDGNVVLKVTVTQDGNSWTKTSKKFFGSKETAEMELKFDEVKLLGGEIKKRINVYTE